MAPFWTHLGPWGFFPGPWGFFVTWHVSTMCVTHPKSLIKHPFGTIKCVKSRGKVFGFLGLFWPFFGHFWPFFRLGSPQISCRFDGPNLGPFWALCKAFCLAKCVVPFSNFNQKRAIFGPFLDPGGFFRDFPHYSCFFRALSSHLSRAPQGPARGGRRARARGEKVKNLKNLRDRDISEEMSRSLKRIDSMRFRCV